MASSKKAITVRAFSRPTNGTKPNVAISIASTAVETEVIDGQVVAESHIVNPGVENKID